MAKMLIVAALLHAYCVFGTILSILREFILKPSYAINTINPILQLKKGSRKADFY